jgi:hypothetical protein
MILRIYAPGNNAAWAPARNAAGVARTENFLRPRMYSAHAFPVYMNHQRSAASAR